VKKVIYSDSSQIVGDEVADVLLEFAAALARNQAAEPITFRALGPTGEEDASFLLGPASQIAVEEADGGDEPDNSAAIAFMRGRIAELGGSAARPQPERHTDPAMDGHEFS